MFRQSLPKYADPWGKTACGCCKPSPSPENSGLAVASTTCICLVYAQCFPFPSPFANDPEAGATNCKSSHLPALPQLKGCHLPGRNWSFNPLTDLPCYLKPGVANSNAHREQQWGTQVRWVCSPPKGVHKPWGVPTRAEPRNGVI